MAQPDSLVCPKISSEKQVLKGKQSVISQFLEETGTFYVHRYWWREVGLNTMFLQEAREDFLQIRTALI